MSADNGIYIGHFLDGFRVAEAQAIDRVAYHGKDSDLAKENQVSVWGDSAVFSSKEEALARALELAEDGYTEYGICTIYFDHAFPRTPKTIDKEAMAIIKDVLGKYYSSKRDANERNQDMGKHELSEEDMAAAVAAKDDYVKTARQTKKTMRDVFYAGFHYGVAHARRVPDEPKVEDAEIVDENEAS